VPASIAANEMWARDHPWRSTFWGRWSKSAVSSSTSKRI